MIPLKYPLKYLEFLCDSENDPALDGIDELLAVACGWCIEGVEWNEFIIASRLLLVADVADILFTLD